jgi:broad specificity phosphatase PhoE
MPVTLMRHAHTEWNDSPKRFQGYFDVYLSEKGKQETLLKSNSMSDFEFVYSSTASRCIETVNILLGATEKIILDDRLLEIDTGEFTGKTNDEVAEKNLDWWDIWQNNPKSSCFPKGETLLKLSYRICDFLNDLLDKYSEMDRVFVLTHGGPIRVCKSILYKDSVDYFWDFPIENLDEFSMSHDDIRVLLKKLSKYSI